ncbi:MAG: response regulator [Candidatus Bathyarchaeota archaeon]|nr:response regulator [Candidatus Bathyarchaeota archaeon]
MSEKTYSILVVDDDESIRSSIAAVLDMEGYIVETAETGKEALQKTQNKPYDIALIDFKLPDTAGTDLLDQFKPTTPPMIKLIVTGYPSLQSAIDSVNNGADGYIQKPVDMEKLLETITKYIKKREENRKYSEQKVIEYIQTRVKEHEQNKQQNQNPNNPNQPNK